MLIVDQRILDDIHRHALETYPKECCGILVGSDSGDDRFINEAHRAKNLREEQHDRYLIDERKLIEVIRTIRGTGKDVVGFYHSHPDYPSTPSQYDSDHAAWPGYSYVIVSVEKKNIASIQAWIMPEEGAEFIEQPINIKEIIPS
jgi:proteasome lid subunit RPN8/RPN11